MPKKIVVIGAGPAGLTVALELLKRGHDVTVLEASSEIGGISRTIRHNRQRIDIGGHRFFSKDERVMRWWSEILPYQGAPSMDDKILCREGRVVPGGPDPDMEDDVFLIRRRISRIYYRGKFFDYPVSFKPQTFINMGLVTSVRAGFSYLVSCIHKLPEDSLENFYINRFGRQLYAMFFEGYTEKVWGRPPRDISADWGAQRVKGVSIATLIGNVLLKLVPGKSKKTETSLIEEFYYPKYGPGQLWETVAKHIEDKGGIIIFQSRVQGIEHANGKVKAVQCDNGNWYEADAVFSSMPLKELIPCLNCQDMRASSIAAGLPYRDFVTVGLLVDSLKLKNQTSIETLGNIVPDCWIYVQDATVHLGRIQIFNNWSPYMLEDPEHTVWVGLEYFCNEGDDFWMLSEQDTISIGIEELKRIGVIDEKTRILDSCCAKVKKAYPAYFDTYESIDSLIGYLNSFENLYCVGRNGQHRYNNMDHSMATAFVAVEALEGKASKEDIWRVNTEQEYHEEKK